MVVSSTLVNVTEDAEIRLVSLLADAAPSGLLSPNFQESCVGSITAGDASALVKTIVEDAGAIAALTTVLDLEDATAAVSILAALVERSNDSKTMAQSLIDGIVKVKDDGTKEAAQRKILLLSIIYNMRDDSDANKATLLTSMFQIAGTHVSELMSPESTLGRLLVDPSLLLSSGSSSSATMSTSTQTTEVSVPPLVHLLDAWKITNRVPLYESICNALPSTDSRKQRFLLLLVEAYHTSTPQSASPAAIAAAKQVVIGAIQDPVRLFVHQRNLLQTAAVQALQTDDPKLLQLFQIFQQGKIADYQDFMQTNAAVLQQYQLDADTCQRHMRILSLCSLAQEHEEIPYAVVAQTLLLENANDVETWVIAAVGSGLLQAKMDQLQEKIMVERAVVRTFDMEQWKALQSRLLSWKQNVKTILQALKEAKHAASHTTTVAPATTTVAS